MIDGFSPEDDGIAENNIGRIKEIFSKLKIKDKLKKEKKEIDVVISPFLIQSVQRQSKAFSPFWYRARLDEDGKLSIPVDFLPIMPRKYLSPVIENAYDENFIFGDLDVAESAIVNCATVFSNSYSDYIKYVRNVFKTIIESETDFRDYAQERIKERDPEHNNSFMAYRHKITSSTAIIGILSEEKIKAGLHILRLYNYLCHQSEYLPLLRKMIDGETNTSPFLPEEEWIRLNKNHLGQMNDSFSLSFSQRRSLYTILDQWDNNPVHVVNGPPGTGKTTLLQSIVADMVVKSAINREPCIIWGSAATNQAVKNIIDSFSRGGKNIRWLPTNSSFHGGYGTFFPSSTLSLAELDNINYIGFDYQNHKEIGTFAEIANEEYLSKANETYIACAKKYFNLSEDVSIEEVVEKLWQKIITYKNDLSTITNSASFLLKSSIEHPEYWDNEIFLYEVVARDLLDNCIKLSSVERFILISKEQEQKLRMDLRNIKKSKENTENTITTIEKSIMNLQSNKTEVMYNDTHIPFLRRLLYGKKIHARNSTLIDQYQRDIEHCSSELNSVKMDLALLDKERKTLEEKIAGIISEIRCKSSERFVIFNRIEIIESLSYEFRKWKDAVDKLKVMGVQLKETSIPVKGEYTFYDELDKLRAKLFALSIRYWEGRWLLETKLSGSTTESESSRLKRYAMLTPCFVSTFHSAPQKLSYWDREIRYLTGFIDCLIVDEAGQASPEISMAQFALAKKAVVVGDVKQIEPVWNILNSVDKANLETFELNSDGSNDFNGRLCSCGSLMRIAQAACAVKDESIEEKGNILLEHRRCLPEIIKYCSNLAYNGKIKPMRKSEKKPFPPMAFFNVKSESTTKNGSKRVNPDESKAICEWLLNNREEIEKTYGDVEECVGILTPFRGQKEQLHLDLEKSGFKVGDFKMGTVHALQGAEKPIVLFSSVYTKADNVKKMFFDGSVNMLNVAVSRAKDSFILFGDKRVFSDKDTPSGKLFELVQENELTE